MRRRESLVLGALGVAMLGSIVLVTALYLVKDRDFALVRENERGELLSKILLGHVNRSLASANTLADLMAKNVQAGAVPTGDAIPASAAEQKAFQDQFEATAAGGAFSRTISLVTEDGLILNSSEPEALGKRVDWRQLGFDRDILDRLELGLPMRSRNLTGFLSHEAKGQVDTLPLAKAFQTAEGKQLVMLIMANPRYMVADFAPLIDTNTDSALVFDYAGRVVASTGGPDFTAGTSIGGSQAVTQIDANREFGAYEELRGPVPRQRPYLFNFRTSVNTPASVAVALSKERLLGIWWQFAKRVLALTAALALLTLVITVALARMLKQREHYRRDLAKSKRAAEAASAAKSAFLANMSHEIRTPINSMVGMTELALTTDLTSEQREYLGIAKASSRNLLLLIDDILDFTRLGAGRLTLEHVAFNLHKSCQSILKGFALMAERKGLDLYLDIAPDVPSEVIGDPLRLGQVLQNLVGNALKFTLTGWVRLDLRTLAGQDGKSSLLFSVSDTGVGVAPEKAEEIFEAFSQEDESVTRRFGGSGLGLAISRHLVELMNGGLGVAPRAGGGSCFSFTCELIPVRPAQQAQSKTRPIAIRQTTPPLLVADPSATSRDILISLLDAWHVPALAFEAAQPFMIKVSDLLRDPAQRLILLVDHAIIHPYVMDGLLDMQPSQRVRLKVIELVPFGNAAFLPVHPEGGSFRLIRLRKPVTPSELHRALGAMLDDTPYQTHDDDTLLPDTSLESSVFTHSQGLTDWGDQVKGRVLVVEDTLMNQRVVQLTLNKLGFEVVIAPNGQVGVDCFKAQTFDLVVMDMQMPVMDGLSATRAIRAFEAAEQRTPTPIVAMTANVLDTDRQACKDVGMNDFLIKPVAMAQFQKVLSRHIRRRQVEGLSVLTMPSAKEAAERYADYQAIDYEAALGHLDDQVLVDDMLLMLSQSLPADWRAFEQHLSQDNQADAAALIHQLKGVLPLFASEAMSASIYQVDQVLKVVGSLKEAASAIAILRHHMTLLLQELAHWSASRPL